MTEDDTFNRLRRAPYSDTWQAYVIWLSVTSTPSNYIHKTDKDLDIFLKDYGWTWEEFKDRSKQLKIYNV